MIILYFGMLLFKRRLGENILMFTIVGKNLIKVDNRSGLIINILGKGDSN